METEHEMKEEEFRGILELIASHGKFWHEWDKLKSMMSFLLKQVLSEYPEVKLSNDQQKSSLGEDLLRSDEKSAFTGESLPMTKGHGDDVTQILHANRGD